MKLTVVSGKGGVGKSMLTSGLAILLAKSQRVVAVDGDVDAPNLHLWLGENEKWDQTEKISVSEKPVIDWRKCNGCGQCVDICAFEALSLDQGQPRLNPFFCEGCGACEAVCPVKAIVMKKIKNAEIRIKKNVHGFPLVSAQLFPGETGSGKIVDLIKKKAESFEYELMILDAPAGTGCPVISAVNGADFILAITEPTPSGFADLKRVLVVVNHFQIPFGIVINKWDLNPTESDKIAQWAGKNFLGQISYDQKIFRALSKLKPVMETNLPVKREIEKIYLKLKKIKKKK
jgi:MinD superfamily P-loop ATPase